jgi:IS5 family transposase
MKSPTRFVERCVRLAKETVVGRPAPAVRKGAGGYADWVMLAILCLKERRSETYRSVIALLRVTPRIRDHLDLSRGQLPDPSTLCKAMDRLSMAVFRSLLRHSTELYDLGRVAAIDASGFDRVAASRRYATRTNYRFQSLKTTILVDCDTGAILDVHCATTKPHDTKIGWQVLKRNVGGISTITADKGYDWDDLRSMLRDNGVRPVIKHREFDALDAAHNARLDDDTYHRRSVVETVFRVLKQRYGDRLTSRRWYRQFREFTLKCAVKNIDDSLSPATN